MLRGISSRMVSNPKFDTGVARPIITASTMSAPKPREVGEAKKMIQATQCSDATSAAARSRFSPVRPDSGARHGPPSIVVTVNAVSTVPAWAALKPMPWIISGMPQSSAKLIMKNMPRPWMVNASQHSGERNTRATISRTGIRVVVSVFTSASGESATATNAASATSVPTAPSETKATVQPRA